MNREGKKCVTYSRVSTEMQVDGYSLAGQNSVLTKFVEREDMILVKQYEDAGKSGKSIDGRPAFKEMLNDIKRGLQVDYIVVYKLSRFGRNAADVLDSLEVIQSYGINLLVTEEGIDSSQASGKLLISVLSAVAEIERENILEQTMNGRKEKARQGLWNGGFAPYGYSLDNGKLIISDRESPTIKLIFDKYLEKGFGISTVASYLNDNGIEKVVRQNGSLDRWSAHMIKLIIDNPIYCGKLAYGRRKKEKVKGTRSEYHLVRQEDYILVDGNHDAIISLDQWNKCQEKRKKESKKWCATPFERVKSLTGLLRCPICGGSMISNESRYQRSDGSIRRYYYYNCLNSKSNNGHECNFKTKYDADLLEEFVIDSIQTSLKNNVFIDSLRKQIGVKTNSDSIKMELEVSKKKLSEIRNSKSRIERDIDSLCSDDKYFERKMNDLKRRLNNQYDLLYEAEDEVERLSAQLEEVESKNVDEKYICKLLDNFKALYENFTANEKTLFMKSIIKRIELNKLGESIGPVKSIEFHFPIFKDYSLLNDSNKFLSHLKEKDYFSKIEFGVDVDNKSEYLNYFSYDKKTNTFIDNRKKTKGEYELVRDYVKTKYHKSPNSGMIAYVKRSLGFEMRDNYNHGKKGKGNRIPSKEMQQYIKDALIELGYYKC